MGRHNPKALLIITEMFKNVKEKADIRKHKLNSFIYGVLIDFFTDVIFNS